MSFLCLGRATSKSPARPRNRRHLDERLRKFLRLKSVDDLPDFCFACGENFDNCECPKGEDENAL